MVVSLIDQRCSVRFCASYHETSPIFTRRARVRVKYSIRSSLVILIKLKLLGPPTIQFSGRFNSVDTDPSFWQPPSLASEHWKFPYRPAIVASVEHCVIVRKGRKGMELSVYPLMMQKEGLWEFPPHIRSRFIPLAMLSINSRTPQVDDGSLANAYIYNTCVTLTVSVDPYLIPVSFVLLVSNLNRCQNAKLPPIYW